MRRTGSGVAALLGAVVLSFLSGCAITPPVLGGPEGATPDAAARFSDADVAGLLILTDDASDPGASSVADYAAQQDADLPEIEPAACRDSAAPLLLLDRDAAAEGTVFAPPPLFRETPGADLVVDQHARRFDGADAAADFVAALRSAREACPAFESPVGRVTQTAETGDFAVPAVGFAVTTTAADGSARESFEWVLLAVNVALSLRADLADADAAGVLRDLAAEYAALFAP